MPSLGMKIGGQVADAILASRLKREDEEYKKAHQGKSEGKQPITLPPTSTFNRGAAEDAYQAQRAGERMDFSEPGAFPGESMGQPSVEPDMGWQMDSTMGMSLYGSGQFTAKEIRKGYRRLGKA